MTNPLHRMRDLETVLKDLQYEISTRLGLLSQLNQVASAGLSPEKGNEERQRLQMEGDKRQGLVHQGARGAPELLLQSTSGTKGCYPNSGEGWIRPICVRNDENSREPAGDHRRQARDKELENVLTAVDDLRPWRDSSRGQPRPATTPSCGTTSSCTLSAATWASPSSKTATCRNSIPTSSWSGVDASDGQAAALSGRTGLQEDAHGPGRSAEGGHSPG